MNNLINEAYQRSSPRSNPRYATTFSIIQFLETSPIDIFKNVKSILEIGCGECSVFENFDREEIIEITSIDLSEEAINRAILNQKNTKINYSCKNLFELDFSKKFDLIIDSHFLHYLISETKRAQALSFINSLLSSEGYFLGETMTSHKKMAFSETYYFDLKDEVLFKFFEDKLIPQKMIKNSINIEKELLVSFDILYFYINSGLKFIIDNDRENPKKEDPDTLRFISQRK